MIIPPQKRPRFNVVGRRLYALAIVLPCLVMLAVWTQPWVPVYELLGDPMAVAKGAEDCCHTYYGIVSNLGVLVWWLAAAISGFTAIVLFARDGFSEDYRFLASAALFTAILTPDDFLMLHEKVLPGRGVPQVGVVSVYIPAALAFLWRFWSTIMAADYYVFFAGGGFLALSLLIDQFYGSYTSILAEDGAKLLGISLWTAFFSVVAFERCLWPRSYARRQRPL